MAMLPSYYEEARRYDGLREIVGSKHEREIVEFFAEAGHPEVKDDETAWCAAFANAMLARAGFKGTGKLTARSFLDLEGAQVLDERDAREGDIVVFKRGNSTWQGHVSFFVAVKGDHVRCFGGNQSNGVNEASYKRSDVLGYRRPTVRIGTKAATRVESDLLRPSSVYSKRVEAMQEVLDGLGYHVGTIDGKFGNRTRDAVLAWKADNGLPLSFEVSPGDLARMERSAPRPVGEARADATAKDLKKDPVVKGNSDAIKAVVATAVTVGAPTVADQAGVLDGVKRAAETVGQAKGVAENIAAGAKALGVVDVAAFVSSHGTLLVIVGVLIAVFFLLKSRKAAVEDYRTGRKS